MFSFFYYLFVYFALYCRLFGIKKKKKKFHGEFIARLDIETVLCSGYALFFLVKYLKPPTSSYSFD